MDEEEAMMNDDETTRIAFLRERVTDHALAWHARIDGGGARVYRDKIRNSAHALSQCAAALLNESECLHRRLDDVLDEWEEP